MTTERPWSVPVRAETVPETGLHLELAADEQVRAAIARLAGVNAVLRLEAVFDLAWEGQALRVDGHVSATVGQTCVVSLEPVENLVEEPVRLVFAPGGPDREGAEPAPPAAHGGDEAPEALVDGCADLGSVATEFLLLGIDPYPRKTGAAFAAPNTADQPSGPFAALAALKQRSQSDD